MGRVRVYIACSLDGFIAGEGHDLSWLGDPSEGADVPGGLDYDTFIADIGAMLMGRATYDVVEGFDAWYYGDLPILVATNRPLTPVKPTVRAVSGSIDSMLDEALEAAGDKDVYLDGGVMIRQALERGRIDELVITYIPVVLGAGHTLFSGTVGRHHFHLDAVHTYRGGAAQVVLRPKR